MLLKDDPPPQENQDLWSIHQKLLGRNRILPKSRSMRDLFEDDWWLTKRMRGGNWQW